MKNTLNEFYFSIWTVCPHLIHQQHCTALYGNTKRLVLV